MNREVAVKTLIGKGRQYLVKEVNLQVNTKPSKALGCWIINHQYVPCLLYTSPSPRDS